MLRLPLADDWHLHLREGEALHRTVCDSARHFHRLLAMPNLVQPIDSVERALSYRDAIHQHLPPDRHCQIYIPLYLTDNLSAEQIKKAAETDFVCGVKLYPAGATTHSAGGISKLNGLSATLEHMQRADLPLLIHAEVTDPEIDIFDREARFIERYLEPWSRDFPELRMVLEHASTAEAVHFVRDARNGIGATITAHHLLINRSDLFKGGLRPHAFCLPVAKKESDRQALLEAATSGNPRFFLGTDSAPHAQAAKESSCGCAGIYTAYTALELYAEAFDSVGALDRLEAFACTHGAEFYRLPPNQIAEHDSLLLTKESQHVPASLDYIQGQKLIPFKADETLQWTAQRITAEANP
ncbi:MAG: dihydroorotase [Gammaproteobacteria bacterium]